MRLLRLVAVFLLVVAFVVALVVLTLLATVVTLITSVVLLASIVVFVSLHELESFGILHGRLVLYRCVREGKIWYECKLS